MAQPWASLSAHADVWKRNEAAQWPDSGASPLPLCSRDSEKTSKAAVLGKNSRAPLGVRSPSQPTEGHGAGCGPHMPAGQPGLLAHPSGFLDRSWPAVLPSPVLGRCSLNILAITELPCSVRGSHLEELLSFIGDTSGLRGY